MQKILELIKKESLKPGDRLPPENQLAEFFGVSRSTIRETLRALSTLNIIERSKRGTFISPPPNSEQDKGLATRTLKDCLITDLLEWRKLLEGETCALAATRATDEDIEQIGIFLSEMEKSAAENNLPNFIQADAAFHLAVAEATHNQVADRMLRLVRNELVEEIGEALNRDPKLLDHALQSHRLIFEAIKNEETDQAKNLIIVHLNEVSRAIQSIKRIDLKPEP